MRINKDIMAIDHIKAMIDFDESQTLELKKTTGELKDCIHLACTFLNTVTTFENTQQLHEFKEPVKLFLLPIRFLCRDHIFSDSA